MGTSYHASLVAHPALPHPVVAAFEVSAELLQDRRLKLQYQLNADLEQLHIPASNPADQIDGLWQHTCFEAFVAVENAAEYREFNFAPSGQWAAYAFSDYRKRQNWHPTHRPEINLKQSDTHLSLSAYINAEDLPDNPLKLAYVLGLTAVLETRETTCSFWALHHPSDQPDFHHRGGFALTFQPV